MIISIAFNVTERGLHSGSPTRLCLCCLLQHLVKSHVVMCLILNVRTALTTISDYLPSTCMGYYPHDTASRVCNDCNISKSDEAEATEAAHIFNDEIFITQPFLEKKGTTISRPSARHIYNLIEAGDKL